jgi:hypothetical protein
MLFCEITGCAYFDIGNSEWRRHSILPNDRSIEELNAIANNPTNSQNERAIAVFKLFAHHIPPGLSAKDVYRVLANAGWLNKNDVPIYESNIVGGYIPVELNGHDSVFEMSLFPEKGKHVWSPWVIYIRLSGRAGLSGAPRSAEDASAFFHGDTTLYGNCTLEEFALCFPDEPVEGGEVGETQGWLEIFSRKGIRVDSEDTTYSLSRVVDNECCRPH